MTEDAPLAADEQGGSAAIVDLGVDDAKSEGWSPRADVARVVALGGSAGSIGALQAFFGSMPGDSGLAFVVVVHLLPTHESALSEVLQRVTSMPVAPVRGGEKLAANHIYVIPPGKHLSMIRDRLHLAPIPSLRGRRVSVDLFLRTLADNNGPHAAAVILSGADGDGAIGLKRIKERGGFTLAQDPKQAEHSAMPRSAVATGLVDWVLPVEAMAACLIEYFASERSRAPDGNESPSPAGATLDGATLRDVLLLLRTRTDHDFTCYKTATVQRRVARRMQVNDLEDLPAYLSFLRSHSGEVGALLRDLLISVTNFFRDAEAFDALAAQIPTLFEGKTRGDTLRVWVAACATGEEAYSVAMLLSEHASTLESAPSFQVFATDLAEDAIATARQGMYPDTISLDVSPERLQRFFVKEYVGYRLRREVRDKVIFAVHDVLTDSPFSRLALVSCRNLLIYLNREAQQRLFETFHFALTSGGLLFLGSSEAIGEADRIFAPIDKNLRLFERRAETRARLPAPAGPGSLATALARRERDGRAAPTGDGNSATAVAGEPRAVSPGPQAFASHLHLKLIERLAPPSLVVNAEHDIVHLSEHVGEFLHFAGGEPSTKLLRALHPSLRSEVRSLLFRARQSGEVVGSADVQTLDPEVRHAVQIRVLPAGDLAPGHFLVTFERGPNERVAVQLGSDQPDELVIGYLERELERSKRHLGELAEQHGTSNEELKASNEELQAMNEELRSATEELETGREELQSLNEELTMMNQELTAKLDELRDANGDLRNLMDATAIATVFLDREHRIMRFTPSAAPLFRLIATDIGRPLADLQHHLLYPELLADAENVLQQLVPIEREVSDHGERVFAVRLLPYRTTDNHIAGVVLTFVDVTERHQAGVLVRRAKEELELRVQARTSELAAANQALRLEIAQHQDVERRRQQLQVRLLNAQEDERKRISRELHDEVGQQLAALMLSLKSLESATPGEQTAIQLRALRATAETAAHEIHELATHLRPPSLDDIGLSGALRAYLGSWSSRTQVDAEFFGAGIESPRLPDSIETTLFRIVQEALTNVAKHAQARRVSVSVERRADHVLGIVEDDGRGFDSDQPADVSQIGLAGMRERVALLQGEFTIVSSAGHGTMLRVRIPLAEE